MQGPGPHRTRLLATILALLPLAACDQPGGDPSDGAPPERPVPELLAQSAAAAEAEPAPMSHEVPHYPEHIALFGELHVHTMNSPDAFMMNVRVGPEEAYRFAQGEAIAHVGGEKVQLSQPLDFLAVTDHSEYMGILPQLFDSDSELASLEVAQALTSGGDAQRQEALLGVLMTMGEGKPIPSLVEPGLRYGIWQQYVELADRFYHPGEFTTLVGYEWTSSGALDEVNLHRNVIFRSSEVPDKPFSSFDSVDPRDLWLWLDEQRAQGIEALAISHNSNLSNGLMFPDAVAFDGEPLDAEYAELRQRNEPLAEITQIKGSSETHPLLSPNDEWAGFEILGDLLGGRGTEGEVKGSYVRDAWLTGLQLEAKDGFNPYRFGVIGASDGHNATSPVEEDNYHGKIGFADGTPEQRRSGSFINVEHVKYGASGLAGVWAESNTREAIFDALARREVFGTSGPRIKVRFFGGWDWPQDILERHDAVRLAYADGAAMGADLPAHHDGAEAPQFLVWAMKDPASAWLQRVQVVKGWVQEGGKQEQVYDVACSDGLEPDAETHRCPDNGAQVSLTTCDISRDKGATQLQTLWRDPDFNPEQAAFYYVRVLENPTCRWSTWDSLRNGLPLPDSVPPTLQERAYTSPIWYRPKG